MSIQSSADAYGVTQTSKGISGPVGGSAVFWRGKRLADIVVSLALLPALGLVAAALLVLNRRFNKGPLFFRQTRMGQDLVPFTAIKFRSMQPAARITRSVADRDTDDVSPPACRMPSARSISSCDTLRSSSSTLRKRA